MTFFHDILDFRFLQYAILAALMCSVTSGAIGTFVVIRRSTYVTGAVAHSALGGIGLSRYLQVVHDLQWFTPMLGAILAALATTAMVAFVRVKAADREDTILSVTWALGMAMGVTFMSMTPGYAQDLMGYLFGDILLVSRMDLVTMFILTLLVLAFIWWNFDRLLAVSFNAQLAELRGANAFALETLFAIASALTVVVLVRLVGIVLVIALLTLPAATAARWSRSLPATMCWAIAISAVTMLSGIWISYEFELPTGATIIECSAALYVLTLFLKSASR